MEYFSNVESLMKEYLDKRFVGFSISNEFMFNSNISKDDVCLFISFKIRINDYDDILCFGNDCSEDNVDIEKKGRLEWGIYMFRKFFFIYKENVDILQIIRNKRKVWDEIVVVFF